MSSTEYSTHNIGLTPARNAAQRRRVAFWGAQLVLAVSTALMIAGCPTGEGPGIPSPEVVQCDVESPPIPSGLQIFVDGESPASDAIRADMQKYFARVTGSPWTLQAGTPSEGSAVWISATSEAQTIAGGVPEGGYTIVRRDVGGADTIVVTAANDVDLAYGAYAFLEELGIRFFHPKDELIPTQFRWPDAIDIRRQPATKIRGIHMHTLHPVETFDALFSPGEQNLADAKELIDWLVKTGHNRLQWYLMSTIDLDTWSPHATAIAEYAHGRGVDLGMTVQFSAGASLLQNQYALVLTPSAQFEDQLVELESRLDLVLATAPFDHLEIAFGEFFASDPTRLVEALDHAIAYLADVAPNVTLAVQNHIGNYEELYLDLGEDEDVYFYHLPGRADPRLIQNVHTVYFFDLYRDWAMYEHESFEIQRNYIFDEIGERDVYYFPESAYWVTADIDVPVFLPEFVYARWLDIHTLTADLDAAGLPPLSGHILYSSGHEWGYWLTDYVTARALWQPEAELEEHLAHVAAPFGRCAGTVSEGLSDLITLQNEMLFDRRLVPYASAEDIHDDLGYAAGIDTHPPRVPFAALRAMSDVERTQFATEVLEPLHETAERTEAIAKDFSEGCETSAHRAWCDEFADATKVTADKLAHAHALYTAVLAAVRGEDPSVVDVALQTSVAVRTDAA